MYSSSDSLKSYHVSIFLPKREEKSVDHFFHAQNCDYLSIIGKLEKEREEKSIRKRKKFSFSIYVKCMTLSMCGCQLNDTDRLRAYTYSQLAHSHGMRVNDLRNETFCLFSPSFLDSRHVCGNINDDIDAVN